MSEITFGTLEEHGMDELFFYISNGMHNLNLDREEAKNLLLELMKTLDITIKTEEGNNIMLKAIEPLMSMETENELLSHLADIIVEFEERTYFK